MRRRIIVDLSLLGLVLLAPWWLYTLALVTAIVMLPFYWEGLFFAFIIQIFYAPMGDSFFMTIPLLVLALISTTIVLREKLRWHL